MLNTREAARFLRVSEASIRRWSDAGLLPGHRVGRRGERRFSESDLLAFMRQPGQSGQQPSMHIAGVETTLPVHLAPLYSSDAGGLRLGVPFLSEGVRRHQPAYLVASGAPLDRYARAMGLDGVEVVHFSGTAAGAIAQWEDTLGQAVAAGATVIRIVGEMAAERTMFSSEAEMLVYEEAFDLMCRRYPVAVLCQYDVREFDGVALLRALKAHPDLFGMRSGAFLN